MMIKNLKLIFFLTTICNFAYAEQALLKVNVSPNMCIASEENSQCTLLLQVELELAEKTDLCVIVQEIKIKHCVLNQSIIRFKKEVVLSKNISVEIFDQKSKTTIFHQSVKIAQFEPAKMRTRRNLGWIL